MEYVERIVIKRERQDLTVSISQTLAERIEKNATSEVLISLMKNYLLTYSFIEAPQGSCSSKKYHRNIVPCLLKAGISEPEEMSIAR
jgi:hypothetical protein